jgi:hypothetical protein
MLKSEENEPFREQTIEKTPKKQTAYISLITSDVVGKKSVELEMMISENRLCGLVVRVLGYRSGDPGSIPGTTRKGKVMGLERGPLSLLSTTEESSDSCLQNREYGRRDPSR